MKKGFKNNIRFNYLYRDAGNYKKYGFVVFANPNNLPINEANNKISENLISHLYFDPKSIKVPALFFEKYDAELDHPWNEFESAENAETSATDDRTIGQFIQNLVTVKQTTKYSL